ncbi:MAG: terminase large subunit [Geminicoccaceae bacterium]
MYSRDPISDPDGRGERAVKFLSLLRHPQSETGRFDLTPWLERIVRRVYGDRRIRTVFMMLPRGGRKTTIGAGLSLLHTVGPERVAGGLAVLAAHNRGQARIAFEEALSITLATPALRACTRPRDAIHRIEHIPTRARLQAASSEAGSQHGQTPQFTLCDELHIWRGRQLWDVLRTGAAKSKHSLLWVITTAGAGQDSVAYDIYSYAKRVQLGEIDDPGFLPLIWEAPRDCAWQDEAVWHAVNPGLEYGFPALDGLRQLAREARNRPAQQQAFRQLHLDIWSDASASPFVDMAVYDAGAVPVDLDRLERDQVPCWLGVDCSSVGDLTAIAAAWPDDAGGYDVWAWLFCPAANLEGKSRGDEADYPRWVEDGWLEATPGNVIDRRRVEAVIREIAQRFNVIEIAADAHFAQWLLSSLAEDGYPAVETRTGWVTMTPAVNELERAIVAELCRHGGNPVLRWCFSNIAIEESSTGNRNFHKRKSRSRIDGAVATAIAVGRAHANETRPSPYEERGLLFV